MADYNDVITEYLGSSYETIRYLDEDKCIRIVRSTIDGKYYVLKLEKCYDIKVYQRLKELDVDGVPKVFEMIKTEAGLIVIEEYINGPDIETYINSSSDQYFDKEQFIANFVKSLCGTLKKLHKLDPPIIHRDIKPQNILYVNDSFYLVDFNIAREYEGQKSKDTFAMGTQDFAAPEQYGFSESDVRTDIYGIGATVKYLCDTYDIHSERLSKLSEKATEMDPDNRFQSVEEIERYLDSGFSRFVWRVKKFALPGFRSGNVLHMLVALVYYVFVIYIVYDFKMTPNHYSGFEAKLYDFLGGLCLFINAMFFALFNNNYLGIRDILFNHRRIKNRALRYLLILILDVCFFALFFLLYLLVVILIFGVDN